MLFGSFFFHLLGVLRKALWRVLSVFAVVGLMAAVVTEIVAIVLSGGHLPTLSTHIIALALGLGAGWAAGGSVMVAETLSGLIVAVEDVERDFVKEIKAGIGLAETAAKHLESR
jgi:hypothetical protein